MTEQVPAGEARSGTDRVFGIAGGAMVLLAFAFFVRSLLPGGSDAGPAAVPELAILSPAPGAVLPQPAEVEFDAGTPLVLGRAGWEAGGRHVHLFVGPMEVMAAGRDIQPVRGTVYRWTLPRLPEGETTLRLTWSGADHGSLEEGASPTVPVVLGGRAPKAPE